MEVGKTVDPLLQVSGAQFSLALRLSKASEMACLVIKKSSYSNLRGSVSWKCWAALVT